MQLNKLDLAIIKLFEQHFMFFSIHFSKNEMPTQSYLLLLFLLILLLIFKLQSLIVRQNYLLLQFLLLEATVQLTLHIYYFLERKILQIIKSMINHSSLIIKYFKLILKSKGKLVQGQCHIINYLVLYLAYQEE